MQNDKDFQYLTTSVTVIKSYPVELFGVKPPRDFDGNEEAFAENLSLVKEETRSTIKQLFNQYFDALSRELVSCFKVSNFLNVIIHLHFSWLETKRT